MKDKEEKRIKELSEGEQRLTDTMNPQFLFSATHTDLHVQIARGTIRTKKLALKELRKRGLDRDGLWVGFKKGFDKGR